MYISIICILVVTSLTRDHKKRKGNDGRRLSSVPIEVEFNWSLTLVRLSPRHSGHVVRTITNSGRRPFTLIHVDRRTENLLNITYLYLADASVTADASDSSFTADGSNASVTANDAFALLLFLSLLTAKPIMLCTEKIQPRKF